MKVLPQWKRIRSVDFLFSSEKPHTNIFLCLFVCMYQTSKGLVIASNKYQLFYLQKFLPLPRSQHPERTAKLTFRTKQYVNIQLQWE